MVNKSDVKNPFDSELTKYDVKNDFLESNSELTEYEGALKQIDDFLKNNKGNFDKQMISEISNKLQFALSATLDPEKIKTALEKSMHTCEKTWLNDPENLTKLEKVIDQEYNSLKNDTLIQRDFSIKDLNEISKTLKSPKYRVPLVLISRSRRTEKKSLEGKVKLYKKDVFKTNDTLGKIGNSQQKIKALFSKNREVTPLNTIQKVQKIEYMFDKGIAEGNYSINEKVVKDFIEIQKTLFMKHGIDLYDRTKDQVFVGQEVEKNRGIIVQIPRESKHIGSFFNPAIDTNEGITGLHSLVSDIKVIRAVDDINKDYKKVREKLDAGKDRVIVAEVEKGVVKDAAIFEKEDPMNQRLVMKEKNGQEVTDPISLDTGRFFDNVLLNGSKIAFLTEEEYKSHCNEKQVEITKDRTHEQSPSIGLER